MKMYFRSMLYFEKSHTLDPSFELTLSHLGWTYVDAGYHEKNIELAQQALSIYPNNSKYIQNELKKLISFRQSFNAFPNLTSLLPNE